MQRRNLVAFEGTNGDCAIELYHGDIAAITDTVDVLIVSAFAGSYVPTPGTVLGALRSQHGLDLRTLLRDAELDLRDALGLWISARLDRSPFGRLLCTEFVGSNHDPEAVIRNAFAALSLLEGRGETVRCVARPLLAAGLQAVPPEVTLKALLACTREYVRRSQSIRRVLLVELNETRVRLLDEEMDSLLGRAKVYLDRGKLFQAAQGDLLATLNEASAKFGATGLELEKEWRKLLAKKDVRSIELGVLARRLTEFVAAELGAPAGNLYSRIAWLEKNGAAPWLCGYMHVLRHLGNEAAHDNTAEERQPRLVTSEDLLVALLCVQRMLTCWLQWKG